MSFRLTGYPLVAGTLLAFSLGGAASAELTISTQPATAPSAATSAAPAPGGPTNPGPSVEARIKALIDRAEEGKKRAWTLQMKDEADSIARTYQVPDARRPDLDAAAAQAVNESLTAWGNSLQGQLHAQLAGMGPDQAVRNLDLQRSRTAFASTYSRMSIFGFTSQNSVSLETTEPKAQPDWIAAVHKILGPDQSTAWDKTRADEAARDEKQLQAAINRNKENIRQQQKLQVEAQCSDIEGSLHLSPDRKDKLEALGRKVIDEAADKWAEGFKGTVQSINPAQRQMMINGNMFFGLDFGAQALEQPDWKDGLSQLLGPADAARLKAAHDQKHADRQQLMGRIMVTFLDDSIAFTIDERARILPIATRLAKDVPEFYPAPTSGMAANFQPQSFYQAASKASDAELKAILDDSQFKHWRALPPHASPQASPADSVADAPPNPDDLDRPDPVERLLSKFLYDQLAINRRRLADSSRLKIEDILRATKIGADAVHQLEVAAEGDTEQHLNAMRWNYEQNVRGQIQSPLSVSDVKQRLRNFGIMFAQQSFQVGENTSPILDAAAAGVLDDKQRAAWTRETNARTAFRNEAVADLILAELDDQIHLQPEQVAKLRPSLASLVAKCGPDISQMFSPGGNMPWFLSGQFTMVPLAGLLDTDLKTVLTAEQLRRCKLLGTTMNATIWWQNICNIHKQRTQEDLP